MNTTEKEDAILRSRQLLADFFHLPNQFSLQTILNPSELNNIILAIQPCLRHFGLGHLDRPLLLPFRQNGNKGTVWYACASNESQLKALESELIAFIGPTYAHFRMPDESELSSDFHVLPKIYKSGWNCFILCTESLTQDVKLISKWQMLWDLLDQQPILVTRIPKSFDALRIDFDRALLAHDEVAARVAFDAMRDRFGISAENRLFIELRLYAGLEQWEKIAQHHLLPTIINLNLPLETYGDVFEGLYMSEVFPYEQSGKLDLLLEKFQITLIDEVRVLFRSRRQSKRSAVLKSFLLFELSQSNPQTEVMLQLLQKLPDGIFGSVDKLLRETVKTLHEPINPGNAAWEAFGHEQFDRAYEMFCQLPDSIEVLCALIRCVDESEDPDKARSVLHRIEAMPIDVRSVIKARCPKTLPRVVRISQFSTNAQSSWVVRMTWRKELGESLDEYIDKWREWSRSVNVRDLLLEVDFGKSASQMLEDMAIEQPQVFQRVVVLWHEVFVTNSEPLVQFKPIYLALLETLRLPGTFGDVELKLIREVLNQLVRAGMTSMEYSRSLTEIELIFNQVRSPHHISWGLDLCDALAVGPCPEPNARLSLLASVIQAGYEFALRLNRNDIALMKLLVNEAGMEWTGPVDTVINESFESVNFAEVGVVGIYSLDVSACQRAEKVLKSLYAGLDVRINNDQVCTTQLKSLAQRASIFIFAWKTSKHAAYYCIKASVGSDQALVMAQGAGTSSIVNATLRSINQLNKHH